MKRNQGPDDTNQIIKRFFKCKQRPLHLEATHCVWPVSVGHNTLMTKALINPVCCCSVCFVGGCTFFSLLFHLLKEHDLTQMHVEIKLKWANVCIMPNS